MGLPPRHSPRFPLPLLESSGWHGGHQEPEKEKPDQSHRVRGMEAGAWKPER
jgi:hypothetical protein